MGFVQWFSVGDKKLVYDTIQNFQTLGARFLRTGFSWAEWEMESRENVAQMSGREWYQWLMPLLKHEAIEVLPNFLYVPERLARPDSKGMRRVSHAPTNPEDYSRFIAEALDALGDCFEYVEFFNEPHLRQEWNPETDPDYKIYEETVIGAAKIAHKKGKKTVLGGPSPDFRYWLLERARNGVVEHMDVVGFHAFPYSEWGSRYDKRQSIPEHARDLKEVLASCNFRGELWVTETGYPTAGEVGVSEEKQRDIFDSLSAQSEVPRIYWWSMVDLDPKARSYTETQTGFREESFYHFGIKTYDEKPKLLFEQLRERTIAPLAAA